MSLDALITFLSLHHNLTLVVLFLGAYFETLIVTSFFVYGEFFFLAGSILAGMGEANIVFVSLTLYVGAILGDHTSYWIGRIWGDRFYRYAQKTRFLRRTFTESNHKRGEHFFWKYGGWSVVMGRFLGPVSWITPFLAGVFKLPYRTFTVFIVPAVVFGIGQFLVVGYLLGKNYQILLHIVQQYLLTGVFAILCSAGLFYYFRRRVQKINTTIKESLLAFFYNIHHSKIAHFRKIVSVLSICMGISFMFYLVALYSIFFLGYQRLNPKPQSDFSTVFDSTEAILAEIDSTTYYQKGATDIQPINVVLITKRPLEEVMQNTGWLFANSFLRQRVNSLTYFENIEDGILPISDLYFEGVSQDSAYQFQGGTFFNREHLRVWNFGTYKGTPVYIISVSRDEGIDFYRSLTFIVPYHDIDPNVDASRDFFRTHLSSIYATSTAVLLSSKAPARTATDTSQVQYLTDGKISVIEL